jgi:hypothetical protein
MAHICPHCQGPTKLLSVLSDISLLDYYVCEVCGNVLELPKGAVGTLQPLASQPAPRADGTHRRSIVF